MKKYKVSLTFIETVEAEDEEDAKLIANDNDRWCTLNYAKTYLLANEIKEVQCQDIK